MKAPGTISLLLAGGAAAVLAAGCGGQDEVPEYDASPEEGAGTSSEESPAAVLAVEEGTDVGDVVTDGDGYTLYLFTRDGTEPPVSNCAGDCARQWPPALEEDGGPPAGIDADLVGSVERQDGDTQLTLDGWPLYRYAGDVEPGDVNGEGVGGTWYAVAPGGGKAAEAATDGGAGGGEGTAEDGSPGGPAEEDGSGGGGYGDGSDHGDDGGYGY